MEWFDLQIPLRIEGDVHIQAILRMPRHMSWADYEKMREAICWNLDHFRDAMVREPLLSEEEPEPKQPTS